MPRVIRVNHIGIATSDIEAAQHFFVQGLGLSTEKSEDVPGDAVRVQFLPVGRAELSFWSLSAKMGQFKSLSKSAGRVSTTFALKLKTLQGCLQTSSNRA